MRLPLFSLFIVSALPAAPVEFNRDIRPILAEACFHCHGPDPGSRKASLRFDTEAGFFAKREDGPTVVKGKPEASPMYQRMISTDPEEIMPPPDAHHQLKPEQIAKVKAWIAEGAPWQPHWSLIAPQRPKVPAVKDGAWPKSDLDRFVLAALDSAGLKPAPEADAYTLTRRVALDLTGLPPSPELIARYVDPTDQTYRTDHSYDQLVTELLNSPAYGEHRARYWLDAARYGDSHGLHFDKPREMWPYRDWVVNAFNANQPFDQFTIEQLAGDLLPKPTREQLVATGLQRCNITTNEGGTIDEENLANYASDRVQTLGWMYFGLTTNCAQCHDHKFDPITAKDYYSLAAFFRNTTQRAKDGNVKDGLGPVIYLPSKQDQPRYDALPQDIAKAIQARDQSRTAAGKAFDGWLAKAKLPDLDQSLPKQGMVHHAPLIDAASKRPGPFGSATAVSEKAITNLGPVGDFDAAKPFTYSLWVNATRGDNSASIIARMDVKGEHRGWDLMQSQRQLSVHLISSWPNNAIKVTTKAKPFTPNIWHHITVTYDGSQKAQGIKLYFNGAPQEMIVNTANFKPGSPTTTKTPLLIGRRSTGPAFEGFVQDLRLYDRAVSVDESKILASADAVRKALANPKRSAAQRESLLQHYLLTQVPAYQEGQLMVSKLEDEKKAIEARSPLTHVQVERTNMMAKANILMRGQYDKVGEEVIAALPAALGQLPSTAPKNRMGLAQWLVSPENTLTARVTVNRFWQELFGKGLVVTAEDFGIMGSPPTHPELLDWLAIEFREKGWNVKELMRLMVTSATYRQAALSTPEKIEKDRDNKLLSRGPRFRMDAEVIRDYALAASNTLSPKMGGPGTMPYQPENIWEIVGLGTEKYKQDTGENLYRRTLYNFWKRMSPSPNMEIFNAPSRETSCVRRERTNTPLQALVTMNDPQFIEAARRLAEKALQTKSPLDDIATRVLCRPLRNEERTILEASHSDLLAFYKANAKDATALITTGDTKPDAKLPPAEVAAWTMVCNQLMNLDEVLNK